MYRRRENEACKRLQRAMALVQRAKTLRPQGGWCRCRDYCLAQKAATSGPSVEPTGFLDRDLAGWTSLAEFRNSVNDVAKSSGQHEQPKPMRDEQTVR